MLYTITEMRRYYFISDEKKLKEKGISVILLMPLHFIFKIILQFFSVFHFLICQCKINNFTHFFYIIKR